MGPNGSGKSNIADAVRWALGEQSMKSLRGKKSEDVIFTGSSKKSRMSAAIVSLYLDNSDKRIPLDYEEVVLTRKLFRNGESEYLINKNRVRLTDIVDLLARSGVSQRGYCVINQGMADSILVASPAERMIIFEEATGVRRFQIKKQQTINKLELTQRNLQRVTDLLGEIQPRLNSLRRQASRAQKRGDIEKELTAEQEKLFSSVWARLNRDNEKRQMEKEKLEKMLEKCYREVNEAKNKLSQTKNAGEDYSGKFNLLQKEMNLAQEALNDLQKNLSVVRGRIQIEKERKKRIENPEYVPINLGYVKEKISAIASAYNKLLNRIEKLASLDDVKSVLKEGVGIKRMIESLFGEVKEGKISQTDDRIKFDDSALRKLEAEEEKISRRIEEYSKRYEEIKEKIYQLNRKEQEKREMFFQLEKELQLKQEELNRIKDRLNLVNIELAKFEVRKEDLVEKIKSELGASHKLLDEIRSGSLKSCRKEEYFNEEESELKVRKLKAQLEQIGGIDPLVVDEYEETKKRFEFLSAQLDDLTAASKSLRKVIKELEGKIEKMFKSSFRNINREFDKYFKVIFGGGKASLSIKYSDSFKGEEEGEGRAGRAEEREGSGSRRQKIGGIEINAAPPGKKVNSLSMLSGGERALTSIAVLFAIISNNPPPFSFLDEIDAALDEANSIKLSRIIKDISSKTQFILVTHNREIMKEANVLYGITMGSDGVSKVVSLKLEK